MQAGESCPPPLVLADCPSLRARRAAILVQRGAFELFEAAWRRAPARRFLFPLPYLLLGLVLLPFLDLWLLLRIGARTGPGPFLAWCAITVVVGLALWRNSRGLLSRRIAGALLIFPGPLSDILALILLIPALRSWLLGGLVERGSFQGQGLGSLFKNRTYDQRGPSGRNGGAEPSSPGGKADPRWPRGEVKDAEFRILPQDQPREERGSEPP